MIINFNLFELKQRLQIKLGKEVSWAQLAKEAGLHRNTIERIASNQTDRVDLETLGKLLMLFHNYGMDVDISDLLVIETSTKDNG